MIALVLGAGGLGCPAALALAEDAAATGLPLRLRIVDPDSVAPSNLARQILFSTADVGHRKAEVAARRIRELVRGTAVEPHIMRFEPRTADELFSGADVVLDGTDDFQTRFFVNDAACARGVPLVHGAVLGWMGQLATILPGKSACLRCLFEAPPEEGALPTCAEAGVAAPLCGLIGSAMARAAVAVLRAQPRAGVLDRWDGLRGAVRPLVLHRDPACPACAAAPRPASTHVEEKPCPSP